VIKAALDVLIESIELAMGAREVQGFAAQASCATTRSCGKLVRAIAMQVGAGDVRQTFTFRAKDGRMDGQDLAAPFVNRPSNSLSFEYDNFGRQNLAIYPDNRQIVLEFQHGGVKQINQVPGISLPYATMGRLGDYNADGSMATFMQGNGLGFHRIIDGAERTGEICYDDFPFNPEFLALCHSRTKPSLWDSGTYQYDGTGNIMAIGADVFTHDRLNRLLTAKINRHPHLNPDNSLQPAGFVNMAYNYDAYGNIMQRYQLNTTNVSYLSGSDPAERFTTRSYTNGPAAPDNKIHDAGFLYDGNGNMISDGKKDFLYDELNQQYEVRDAVTACAAAGNGGGSFDSTANSGQGGTPANMLCYGAGPLIESNIYGADGMRAVRHVEKVVGLNRITTDTAYVRLGGNVVKEYTEEKRVPTSSSLPEVSHEKAYIYGPLGLLATEELCSFNCTDGDVAGAPTTRYYEYDHLGTIRAITNANGSLQSTFDYEPFGLELKGTTVSFTDTSSNTHRFTGHERDEEVGEDYMKARMYVLSTARFPQIDPQFGGAGDPQNWNAYIYVGNSPVGASDPTGMATVAEHSEIWSGTTNLWDSNNASSGGGNPVSSPGIAIAAGGLGISINTVSALMSMGFTLSQMLNLAYHGVDSSTKVVTSNQSGSGAPGWMGAEASGHISFPNILDLAGPDTSSTQIETISSCSGSNYYGQAAAGSMVGAGGNSSSVTIRTIEIRSLHTVVAFAGGKAIAQGPAYSDRVAKGSGGPTPFGTYNFKAEDQYGAEKHRGQEAYGPAGIIHFDASQMKFSGGTGGHSGRGLHSGGTGHGVPNGFQFRPGTQGCTRTNDRTMTVIDNSSRTAHAPILTHSIIP
jgi:RHS repeat-associated protein